VQFTRVGGGGFKRCFDVDIVVSCEIDISICGIALATSSLAAKTTALIAQVATATASSGTYGFNAFVGCC
jgi:hypothetical protein